MNTNLLSIVKQIAGQYGEHILADPARLKAFFGDLAKDEPKPLRIAFGRCIEEGAYDVLKSAPDAAERASRKASIARRVHDEHGIDTAISAEALDILEAALFENTAPEALCKNCGKTLQEDWKACPYCGTARGAAPSAPPPAQPKLQTAPAAIAAPHKPAKKKHPRNALIAAGVFAAVLIGVAVYRRQVPAAIAAVDMVRIPGGTFTMGSPSNEVDRGNEEVQHQVTVSGFYMGKYEVSQREWRELMGNNPSNWKGDNLPVENVNWYEAVEFCNRRSRREGLTPAYTINGTDVTWNRNANGYRLPTEAEWEYACRAGTTTPFNTGNNITTGEANYNGNYPYNNNAKGIYRERTVEVGSFTPNRWGLYEMHGNVWEWCWDRYGNYSGGAQGDPAGPSTGANRVIRGGAWYYNAQYLRSATRFNYTPTFRNLSVGFRLVRSNP